MTMQNTLLLDRKAWDLVLDSSGNIALATPSYALAQDVASAIRVFKGELWYDTLQGIPYFQKILGHLPPIPLLSSLIEKAALSVPGIVRAKCQSSMSGSSRAVLGQVQFIDEAGAMNHVRI